MGFRCENNHIYSQWPKPCCHYCRYRSFDNTPQRWTSFNGAIDGWLGLINRFLCLTWNRKANLVKYALSTQFVNSIEYANYDFDKKNAALLMVYFRFCPSKRVKKVILRMRHQIELFTAWRIPCSSFNHNIIFLSSPPHLDTELTCCLPTLLNGKTLAVTPVHHIIPIWGSIVKKKEANWKKAC